MRRIIRSAALAFSLLVLATLVGAQPAVAQSIAASTWSHGASYSGSQGGLTWYNRSVGVQGTVYDIGDGLTQVYFLPYHGNTALYARDTTRTASEGTVPFGFTLDGSDLVGGISKVYIRTCWYPSAGGVTCSGEVTLVRP
ncbi:MAG TPA: hypothetical protein VGD67_14940 [Pseudonocardiaceae bacterium]